jgi:hypothetical protein
MTKNSSHETQPLLSNTRDAEALKSDVYQYTPLPKAQLGILCYLRILDPLNFSQIFPYINQYLTILRVTDDPSRIGFYSGLVVRFVPLHRNSQLTAFRRVHLPFSSCLRYIHGRLCLVSSYARQCRTNINIQHQYRILC